MIADGGIGAVKGGKALVAMRAAKLERQALQIAIKESVELNVAESKVARSASRFSEYVLKDNIIESNVQKFNDLKEMAENTLNFSTPKDGAVFWSGKNMTKAQSWAEVNGKFTLEQTSGGKYLDNLNLFDKGSGLTGKEASEIWDISTPTEIG